MSTKNLFQTNTNRKSSKKGKNGGFLSHKSPEARPLVNKNGSISYAILPRREINASDLKLTKKMKSPSPQVKLGHDQQ